MEQNLLILCRTKSSSPRSSEENKQYDSGDGSLSIHPVPSRRKKKTRTHKIRVMKLKYENQKKAKIELLAVLKD